MEPAPPKLLRNPPASLSSSLGRPKSSHIAFHCDDVNTLFATQLPAIPEAQRETAPSTDEAGSPALSQFKFQSHFHLVENLASMFLRFPSQNVCLPSPCCQPSRVPTAEEALCYIPHHTGARCSHSMSWACAEALSPSGMLPYSHICRAKHHPDITANFNTVSP